MPMPRSCTLACEEGCKLLELVSTTAAQMREVHGVVMGDAAHKPITDRIGAVETDVAVLQTEHGIWSKLAWTGLAALGSSAGVLVSYLFAHWK
jgi:hypothetical protein